MPNNKFWSKLSKIIRISGGDDATNPKLIGFLKSNAKQGAVTTVNLDSFNVSAGQHTISVVAKAKGYIESSSSKNATVNVYRKLDTPVLSLNGNVLSWTPIENAAQYRLVFESTNSISSRSWGNNYTNTQQTEIDLSSYNLLSAASYEMMLSDIAAEHKIRIVAVGAPRSYYENSDYSNEVVYSVAPAKGKLLWLTDPLGGKHYRIIRLNNNIAEVSICGSSNANNGTSNVYANDASGSIDYEASRYYSLLSEAVKAKIVDKTFQQDSWDNDGSNPYYTYMGYSGNTAPGSEAYVVSRDSTTFGSEIVRRTYALSVQDILDYVFDTSVTDGYLQNYNVWQAISPYKYLVGSGWYGGNNQKFYLRSANVSSNTSGDTMCVISEGGIFGEKSDTQLPICIGFQLDISQPDNS